MQKNFLSFRIPTFLVGGWPTPLKNMTSSVGIMTFPIYGKSFKIPWFQTTNQSCLAKTQRICSQRHTWGFLHDTWERLEMVWLRQNGWRSGVWSEPTQKVSIMDEKNWIWIWLKGKYRNKIMVFTAKSICYMFPVTFGTGGQILNGVYIDWLWVKID